MEELNGNSGNGNYAAKKSRAEITERRKVITGLSTQRLAQALFRGDVDKPELRNLPAQSLYMAIKSLGLESALDVLGDISAKQYSLLLDFEFWHRDSFLEDKFWHWLETIEERTDLIPLQKFIMCLAPSTLALLVCRHVTTAVSDEPTNEPPGPNFYTPDNGHTWVSINVENPTHYHLLGKLLASIFQDRPEYFYQLIATAGEATTIELEEESFTIKRANLLAEGIPDFEAAAQINAPLSAELFQVERNKSTWKGAGSDVTAVEPTVYDGNIGNMLANLFQDLERENGEAGLDEIKGELTLIANAALVYYQVDFSDQKQVEHVLERIKETIETGLRSAAELTKLSLYDLHQSTGLVPIYRHGLKLIGPVVKLAFDSVAPDEESDEETGEQTSKDDDE